MNMIRNRASAAAGVSLAVVLGFIIGNGQKLIELATAFWMWLLLVSEKMPASWASYLGAWGVGLSVMFTLRRWIPDPGQGNPYNSVRAAVIEFAAAAAAFLTVALQVGDLRRDLTQLAFGLIAALTIPLSYRIMGAVGELIRDGIRSSVGEVHDSGGASPNPEGGDP
jgi:hypothetical protein